MGAMQMNRIYRLSPIPIQLLSKLVGICLEQQRDNKGHGEKQTVDKMFRWGSLSSFFISFHVRMKEIEKNNEKMKNKE